MKKRFLSFFLVFFIVFSLIVLCEVNLVLSQSNLAEDIGENVENVNEVINTIGDEDVRSEYLKEEWTKILNETAIGPPLKTADEVLTRLNPIWALFLGLNFTFSWLFFLSILFYLLLLLYSYRVYPLVDYILRFPLLSFLFRSNVLNEEHYKYRKGIWFFVLFVIISSIRIPKFFSSIVVSFISGKGTWYFQLISAFIVVGVILVVFRYAGDVEKVFEKIRQEQKVETLSKKSARQEKVVETLVEKEEKKERAGKNLDDIEAARKRGIRDIQGAADS